SQFCRRPYRRGQQAHHGDRTGRRAQQLQSAARLVPARNPPARPPHHLAQPGEPQHLGFRRQRDGTLRAALRFGRGVPQSQPALPRRGPSRRALIGALGAMWRHLRLTAAELWSKIILRRDDHWRTRLGTRARGGPFADIGGSAAGRDGKARRFIMAARREDFILMTVGGLTLDPTTKMPIVVLKDPDNKLNLPIWIGPLEAASMATELEGIRPQRPMTHDLMRNLLGDLGATVEAVEVTELRENTYFARIMMRTRERRDLEIDSRPSDAIALALRTKSPIYVAKKVLEMSSELHEQAAEPGNGAGPNPRVGRGQKMVRVSRPLSPDQLKKKDGASPGARPEKRGCRASMGDPP